ncbi:MAG: hypothetical protein C0402_04790 [Thermodesulfovibrio sp.]|nr:hypothetical protein [Thermodesulfovibrio sp.]
MAILDFIKGLFKKEEELARKSADKLKALSLEERDREMSAFLYQCCFDNAAKFVHEELHRPGSPFVKLSREHFFNEILLVNFWAVDKVFRKYREGLAEKLHQHYYGVLPDAAERVADLAARFKTYNNEWDDYSGHQDLFGLKIGEMLFGSKDGYIVPEVSYWVISYADGYIKSLKKIRTAYKEAGIIRSSAKS